MKSKLDKLYEEREKINSEIERLKRIQGRCEHIFTLPNNDPETIDGKLIKRLSRVCVACGKVEYSYSLDEQQFESEYSFKRKI